MKIFSRFLSGTLILCLLLSLLSACGSKPISVVSVRLSDTDLILEPGDTYSLTAIVSPSDATDATVAWSSSDESVVTVTDGSICAIADGSATIKATTSNGRWGSCTVSVETPTAYDALNDDEKKFFNMLIKAITQFKNPGSVSVINVDYYDDSAVSYIAEIKAMNGFGGVTSDVYGLTALGLIKGGKISSSGYQFNISNINAALAEYIDEQGW